ncbi:biotin--[acetyl-CoA-carboxylase] ligase [Isoptericola chiayiensis]|uniref:biotin--[biotin carboxyl-carrier protein] ligase n=1 Tax=Isoptericola chiayiensis TaxID=579446 RepID=A0ABP8Y1Y7_9MICO|nr:biotin--[acetyl-CoA-carboxylase] ligase [Isoptericola chiayiensis]NOW01072.1 BirA family biotin operon repressor/biotin-[acetyl-CoA-carboxylase] ligase [Isoptericola chiayiensis]
MIRPALDAASLRPVLLAPAGPLAALDVVAETASTQADLVERARSGRADPAVLVAERQTAGRGRAGRSWEAPARSALTVSFLLRPHVPSAALGWLPLLAGLAVVRTLGPGGVPARLKWPNDVLLPGGSDVDGYGRYRKVAGVLAEVVPDGGEVPAVVLGVGLNVDQEPGELPVPTATSLRLVGGAGMDRSELLVALTGELLSTLAQWEAADGDAVEAGLAGEYAEVSATLGSTVRVELAGGSGVVVGEALRVADDGALVVGTPDGERHVSAGDVHHVRRRDPGVPAR